MQLHPCHNINTGPAVSILVSSNLCDNTSLYWCIEHSTTLCMKTLKCFVFQSWIIHVMWTGSSFSLFLRLWFCVVGLDRPGWCKWVWEGHVRLQWVLTFIPLEQFDTHTHTNTHTQRQSASVCAADLTALYRLCHLLLSSHSLALPGPQILNLDIP